MAEEEKKTVKKTVSKKTSTDKTAKKAAKKPTAKSAKTVSAKSSTTTRRNSKFTTPKIDCSGKTLVIVESPTKAKTISKILGPKYGVLASVGHVRDLPKSRIAIDIDNNFEPEYTQVLGKSELIKQLKASSMQAKNTLLASDPDREGEAIAWHLATLLGIDPDSKCRIRMHEITANGAKSAISSPDKINMDLVDAQQARRVLDRLVGYELSPLLWRKVKRGLSAGRVQSVALRIVCEREDEINSFQKEEYWLVDAEASKNSAKYKLRVVKYGDKEITIANEQEALKVKSAIEAGELTVSDFKVKEGYRKALPPYKTSTLQQDASRRCGMAPRRTMSIAQQLFEGIELPGRGATGLITYMRTDSLRLAPEAIAAARDFIGKNFGKEFLPAKANQYSADSRAQDAHEAIRATDVTLTPDSIKDYLTQEQYRLYSLIWNRYVASQMADAKTEQTTLLCTDNGYTLKQSGTTVVFEGWGKVFPLGIKNDDIRPVKVGEKLVLDRVITEQKFTQPPSRYTEAALIKVLEDDGIGRPSTYATIVETLSQRNYVERLEDRKLAPTKLGMLVNCFLVKNFDKLVNVEFTAKMESGLDKIEEGKQEWHGVVKKFWEGFKPKLDEVSSSAEPMHPEPEFIEESCPDCGKQLVKRNGRFGEFIACSGYPECKYTRNIIHTTGIKCPKCGQGELVRRKATKGKMTGRFFYGCNRYPECDYIAWKKPVQPKSDKQNEMDDYNVSDM